MTADYFSEAIQAQIAARRRSRDEGHLREIFDAYRTDKLSKESFKEALIKLDVDAAKGHTLDEIEVFDLDRDGQIKFEDFKAAALRPSPLETWCKSVDWWQAVADAIPSGEDDDNNPLRAVASLSDTQMDVICAEAAKSIREILSDKASQLRDAFRAIDIKAQSNQQQQSKYATPFKASAGTTADYHKGLSDRVGTALSP
jgi:hypothetical protein